MYANARMYNLSRSLALPWPWPRPITTNAPRRFTLSRSLARPLALSRRSPRGALAVRTNAAGSRVTTRPDATQDPCQTKIAPNRRSMLISPVMLSSRSDHMRLTHYSYLQLRFRTLFLYCVITKLRSNKKRAVKKAYIYIYI